MAIILEDNPINLLGEAEKQVIDAAKKLIKSGIPDKDMIVVRNSYASKNLEAQAELENLRSQLYITASRLETQARQVEANERESLLAEGFKAAGERDAMVFRNSKWRDFNSRIVDLRTIETEVNTIMWILKSGMKAIE